MKRDIRDYLQDIITVLDDISDFVEELSFEEFKENKKTWYAVVRGIEILGEVVRNLPDSLKETYSDVPWNEMAGMRYKLIHGYFGIDFKVVWSVSTQDVPRLKPIFLGILNNVCGDENDE